MVCCQGRPVRGDHASFTGGQVLRGIETERHGIAGSRGCRGSGADRPAFIAGSGRVRRVFDHVNAVPPGQFPDGFHLAGQSRHVHRYDRPRAARDALGDLLRVDVAIPSDIREHRRGAHVQNGLHGGAKCHRRGDHFIARADLQARQREVQPGGGRIHRDRMGCAGILAEFTLEASGARPGSQPPGPQGLHNLVDLFFADRGAMKVDEGVIHFRSPVPRVLLMRSGSNRSGNKL